MAVDVASAAFVLEQHGVYAGMQLQAEDVATLLAWAQAHPCRARTAPKSEFLPRDLSTVNASRSFDVLAADYDGDFAGLPLIDKISGDPTLKGIADAYIGAITELRRVRLWWSFPARRVADADLHAASQDKFHYDLDGWNTVKFFFYLTDTDESSGAHMYLAGSHRRRHLKHQFSLTVGQRTEDLLAYYGADSLRQVCGAAGFGFAEDPFVFHTGALCRGRPRLVLEFLFGPAEPRYGRGLSGRRRPH